MTTITTTEASKTLAAEGHNTNDIDTLIDQMIETGLELDQPDEGYILSADELDFLRSALAELPRYTIDHVVGYTETTDEPGEPIIETHVVTEGELVDLLGSEDRAWHLRDHGRLREHDEWMVTSVQEGLVRKVAVAAEAAATALAARDEMIREAVAAGHSLRTVAAAAGVNHQTVANIVAR